MKYAITGSGNIGTALARTFARKNIEVGIANSRGLTVRKEHVGVLTPASSLTVERVRSTQMSTMVHSDGTRGLHLNWVTNIDMRP